MRHFGYRSDARVSLLPLDGLLDFLQSFADIVGYRSLGTVR